MENRKEISEENCEKSENFLQFMQIVNNPNQFFSKTASLKYFLKA